MLNARQSVFYLFTSRYIILATQTVSMIILARLLSPSEIGVYSVASAFIGIGLLLRDFGISTYIVQAKEINDEILRAAFSAMLLTSILAAFLIFLSGSYIASFYNEPGIESITNILFFNFILIPFGSITISYFRRLMRFDIITKIEVISSIAHAITAIMCAYIGLSYLSLAWASIAGTVTTIISTFFCRPKHLPILPGLKGISNILNFGKWAGSGAIIGNFGRRAPDLIIGKVIDMQAVGLFSRALSLINLFNNFIVQGLAPLLMPFFAAKHRDGKELNEFYLHLVACITGLAWPFFIFISVNASPIILIIFGDQWEAAVPLVKWLCLSQSVYVFTMNMEDMLKGLGLIKRVFRIQTIMPLVRISCILITAPFGIEAVAMGMVLVPIIRIFVIRKDLLSLGIRFLDHAKPLSKSLGVALSSGVGLLLVNLTWSTDSNGGLLLLIVSGVAWAMGWLLGLWLTNHPLETELVTILKKVQTQASAKFPKFRRIGKFF